MEIFWEGTVSAEFRANRLSAKFPHQEIRRNYGILRGGLLSFILDESNNIMMYKSKSMTKLDTAQNTKFSIKDFIVDLVTFTEETLNGKLHVLRSERHDYAEIKLQCFNHHKIHFSFYQLELYDKKHKDIIEQERNELNN